MACFPVFHVDRARLGVEVREGALEGAAEVADLLRMRAQEHVRLGVTHWVGEPRQFMHHLRRVGVGPFDEISNLLYSSQS